MTNNFTFLSSTPIIRCVPLTCFTLCYYLYAFWEGRVREVEREVLPQRVAVSLLQCPLSTVTHVRIKRVFYKGVFGLFYEGVMWCFNIYEGVIACIDKGVIQLPTRDFSECNWMIYGPILGTILLITLCVLYDKVNNCIIRKKVGTRCKQNEMVRTSSSSSSS